MELYSVNYEDVVSGLTVFTIFSNYAVGEGRHTDLLSSSTHEKCNFAVPLSPAVSKTTNIFDSKNVC